MQKTGILTALGLLLFGGILPSPAMPDEKPCQVVSWNAYSVQFIQAPEFTLLAYPKTAVYRAVVQQGDRSWSVEATRPQLSLSSIWNELALRKFSLTFEWRDAQGDLLNTEPHTWTKAPGWTGFHQPPADWVAAADRNIAYLIQQDRERKAPYCEPGVPIWIWSAAGPSELHPQGYHLGYPGNMVPQAMCGLLACVRAGRPQAQEALQLARATANWALTNRRPENVPLPLFPYSTIGSGKFTGGNEGGTLNLPRACWLARGLVDLYRTTEDPRYLDYARHIARVTIRYQQPDGSLPYRIDGKSGQVVETYTPDAVELACLVEALEPYGVEPELLLAAQRAIRWMVGYVAPTHHWQAAYEDVVAQAPYRNLSQFAAQNLIAYLCRHKELDPEYLPLARQINAWVEDQFVIFGPSEAFEHPIQGPMVCEQYGCWYPMEGHTARWAFSLLALHRATGEAEYLDKAKAAGNAICSQQYPSGQFSTFGERTWVEGRMTRETYHESNWYNANLEACGALYQLDAYVRSLEAKP